MEHDLNSSVLLSKVNDFSRLHTIENYEGMLGSLSEDDPKVQSFIHNETPKYTVEFFRLEIDQGQSGLNINKQGKRPTVVIPDNAGETVCIPVPEKRTPPLSWNYKKIGERLIYDLSQLMMCDTIRVGRFPFNHFFPVLRNGALDLTVSREHGLIIYYQGGLHYVDYGSLVNDDEARKDGSTNGTYLPDGEKLNNCMYVWKPGEILEMGQSEKVLINHKEVKKRAFKLIYNLYQDDSSRVDEEEAVIL
ncbi:MAG: hypothetical protein COA79_07785 [Planctomycetota bacterium]|nr:MAG: hypothetical protein COA79_07785 [Planctomycetota bacterium]